MSGNTEYSYAAMVVHVVMGSSCCPLREALASAISRANIPTFFNRDLQLCKLRRNGFNPTMQRDAAHSLSCSCLENRGVLDATSRLGSPAQNKSCPPPSPLVQGRCRPDMLRDER